MYICLTYNTFMLNNIKTKFSIKDLENFTGIKSHTIRIWEKRYELLQPMRTNTNIRYYDSDNFIKLLNINLLYTNGLKISKIAKLSEKEIIVKANEIGLEKAINEGALNQFKVAMVNFDENLFNDTYTRLLNGKPFREIFKDVFIPFLEYIGVLWQTKSIKPAHEHFISNLIIQKLHLNIERSRSYKSKKIDSVFVLFLPLNEIHELGLLYLHYELNLRGLHSIYLGQNIDIEHLVDLLSIHENINFISYFTVQPDDNKIYEYLNRVENLLLNEHNNRFWFLGRKAVKHSLNGSLEKIRSFNSIDELLKSL